MKRQTDYPVSLSYHLLYLFVEMMMEAIEEVGLANAIREGRQSEFVSEDQVLAILAAR